MDLETADLPPIDLQPGPALLQGTSAQPPVTADLTAVGTIDWAHWGLTIAADFDHRSGGGQIPDFSKIGNGTPSQFGMFMWGFSWTNGTPHASATNTMSGVYLSGAGSGFTLDLPADNAIRVLKLFVADYNCTSRLTAHLSDSSAMDFVDDLIDSGVGSYRMYTLRYRALSAAHLHVVWQAIAGTGNVTLEAATLSGE
ncbi:MAG: hypothetical protein JWN44_1526 [Myxococcales bacterium]|nr:hypothetical protein [Myxococcales bacterium]